MQGHFGGHARQRLRQEVRRAHPHLEGGEWMFGCLATHTHRLRVLIETLLHGFEQVLVLPSTDQSLLGRSAAMFDGAALASVGPVTAQNQAAFFGREGVSKRFSSGRSFSTT
jgi:hypothetical protein